MYSDPRLCTISGILRTLVYSEPCVFSLGILRYIQEYAIRIVITTFFFTLILCTFRRNFSKDVI